MGNIKPEALRPSHIQHCYAELLSSGLSSRSVEMAHAVLRAALRDGVKQGLIATLPTEAVTPLIQVVEK
jgi:hypothetical protein